MALEQQLDLARAKLAAALTPTRPVQSTQPSLDAVMEIMRHVSGLLPPDMEGSFVTCLDHIRRVSTVEEVLAPMEEVSGPPGAAEAPPTAFPLPPPALPPPGVAGVAPPAGTGAVDFVEAAGPGAPSGALGDGAVVGPVRGRASGSSSRVGPFSAENDGEDASFISTRSRSHPPGARMRGKAPSSDQGGRTEDIAAAFVRDGKRYFSQDAERIGLDG